MTDSPRRDEPTQRFDSGQSGYSGYTDPAYADQSRYAMRPTEPIPAYGYDQYSGGGYGPPPPLPPEPEPEPPGTPRWLWVVAGIAIVTVVGLVIAMVIVNSSQQDTVVAPVPALTEPTEPTATTPPTTSRRPTTTSRPAAPPPPNGTPPSTSRSVTPGQTEPVVYTVTGQGRAINITFVDNGGVLQTEFNVLLPWTKEVDLTAPADHSASVSIINVGREVSCSISVGGTEVQRRSGSGLTICSPIS